MAQFGERDIGLLVLGVLLGLAGQVVYDMLNPAMGFLIQADWGRFFFLFVVLGAAVLLYLVLIAPEPKQEHPVKSTAA